MFQRKHLQTRAQTGSVSTCKTSSQGGHKRNRTLNLTTFATFPRGRVPIASRHRNFAQANTLRMLLSLSATFTNPSQRTTVRCKSVSLLVDSNNWYTSCFNLQHALARVGSELFRILEQGWFVHQDRFQQAKQTKPTSSTTTTTPTPTPTPTTTTTTTTKQSHAK